VRCLTPELIPTQVGNQEGLTVKMMGSCFRRNEVCQWMDGSLLSQE